MPRCNETDVRLVDGQTPDDGRVEICFNGFWGSVCDDFWGFEDATVVCRQLGYNGCTFYLCLLYLLILFLPVYTPASIALENLIHSLLFYHLDNVACAGGEERLSECVHNGVGVHNCVREEAAGVICSSKV